jgi:hypothetical protein
MNYICIYIYDVGFYVKVAAMSLGSIVEGGLDMANIKVQTTTTVIANNVAESGGSVTSELCAMAVQVCNILALFVFFLFILMAF